MNCPRCGSNINNIIDCECDFSITRTPINFIGDDHESQIRSLAFTVRQARGKEMCEHKKNLLGASSPQKNLNIDHEGIPPKLKRRADNGDNRSRLRLAMKYEDSGNFAEAEKYYSMAQGLTWKDRELEYRLAYFYETRMGDISTAIKWYKVAMNHGLYAAKVKFNELSIGGISDSTVPECRNYSNDEELFDSVATITPKLKRKADNGDLKARIQIGELLEENGYYDAAEKYYHLAFNMDQIQNADLAFRLGYFYEHRTKNMTRARTWYRKASSYGSYAGKIMYEKMLAEND